MNAKPPTADRIRKDVDRGRAGDKVDFPDPAAAPLGTDDEAADRPANSEALRRAGASTRQGVHLPDGKGWLVLALIAATALVAGIALLSSL